MDIVSTSAAAAVKNSFLTSRGRSIAYRIIGEGMPLIMCNRFRGIMDSWDPAFLDLMGDKYQVIIFDYSGVGLSTGELATDTYLVAEDVKDLADGLGIERFVIAGWSYGGMIAQVFSVLYPGMISHTILLGTKPPGDNEFPMEQLFLETSSHLINDFEDEVILFFEPASALSREAAQRSHDRIGMRTHDNDIPVPESVWGRYFQGGVGYAANEHGTKEKLMGLKTPVLVISGDHDLVFPVENWFALNRKMPNLFISVLPQAGHGPQHQFPELVSSVIHTFIQYSEV